MEQKLRRDRRIGDNLRALRDRHGISQEKLCAELQLRGCDIARSCYAKYEAGELNVRISVLIDSKKFTDVPMRISLRDWMPIVNNAKTASRGKSHEMRFSCMGICLRHHGESPRRPATADFFRKTY